MKTVKYISPVGMLGGGFTAEYFYEALEGGVDFVAVDSGSTDGGPINLGGDKYIMSHAAIKRDLRIILIGARRHRIPMLVGSCGGSGGNWNLNWIWEIVQEIAAEEGLHFRVALIEAEPDRELLVRKYREGRFRPLQPAPDIDEDVLVRTRRIVGMMGPEPFIEALNNGADVVLAGRSSDAALFSAFPLSKGMPAGPTWHAAKILECGGAAVDQMVKPEGMHCTVAEDYFEVTPLGPDQTSSPLSVAAHALYETANPYRMAEPGGVMHLDDVQYEKAGGRSVRVRGSRFEPGPYTIKLEGADFVGYRSQMLGAIADPAILDDFDTWLDDAKAGAEFAAERTLGADLLRECVIDYRVFGRNGALGSREPRSQERYHELALLILVLAPTQELASTVTGILAQTILHFAVPRWKGLVSNLAYPAAPQVVELGPAYNFVLNHVVEVDHPLELFSIRYEEI